MPTLRCTYGLLQKRRLRHIAQLTGSTGDSYNRTLNKTLTIMNVWTNLLKRGGRMVTRQDSNDIELAPARHWAFDVLARDYTGYAIVPAAEALGEFLQRLGTPSATEGLYAAATFHLKLLQLEQSGCPVMLLEPNGARTRLFY